MSFQRQHFLLSFFCSIILKQAKVQKDLRRSPPEARVRSEQELCAWIIDYFLKIINPGEKQMSKTIIEVHQKHLKLVE